MTLPPHPAPDARSHEILASIRQTFAEKGFDGASMQDLARAAGMSVGNFYRYFPSKAAIVQAMCGYDLAEIQGEFAEIQTSDTPMTCLRERILNHFSEESLKDGQLWAEITAAAIRKPEIGAAARQMEQTIVSLLTTIFAHTTRRPVEEARSRYEGQCQMLVMLVKAMAIRTAQMGPASPALAEQVVAMIDGILSQISNDKAEGPVPCARP
ncbi:MAG: TetR/AcrR family transcriptional regulator [Tabrizicola sp.]|jgi:AcrR family transcriptional regulator|uniref:TetR/AcrR family transcriptional regulator n=1 Tax=Tabrizicola sp. TaxID=2005166 RepID=UPI001B5B19F6|nr:TetR/AcrR family transcriptional regulator [Tabrizicola sp.]MCC6517503.1 TetR/AcrR family transcriptional regulator [Tabrizicola sp.]